MLTRSRRPATLAALAFVLAAGLPAPAAAQLRDGFRTTAAPRGDDTLTPFVDLGFGVHVRGGLYDAASACTNGYVSLAFLVSPFECPYPGSAGSPATLGAFADLHGTAISVLFRDLDASPAASGSLGYGHGTVDGRQAFGFTWDGVFSFDTTLRNHFQLLFIDRSADFAPGDFDLEYNYGTLAPGTAVAGLADDGGFAGMPYTAAVTAAPNTRVVQCFRAGSVADGGCLAPAVVPEPSVFALAAVGVGMLVGLARARGARHAHTA